MKKLLMGFIVIFVVGTLFARNNGYSPSESNQKLADQSNDHTMVVREGIWQHNLGAHYDDQRNQRIIMDTITIYYDPISPDSYSDFMAGYQTTGDDSIIMRFHLLTSGKVNEMHVMNESGGFVSCWIYGPAYLWVDTNGDGEEDTGYTQMPGEAYVDEDQQYASTLQELTPFGVSALFHTSDPATHFNTSGDWDPWNAPNGFGWNVMDFVSFFGDGVLIESGTEPGQLDDPDDRLYVWVGYSGVATIYQDGNPHYESEEGPAPSLSTLHSITPAGAWYRIWTGNEDWYAHILQVVVQYDAVPPMVTEMVKLSDTFNETSEIWADVVDLDGDAFACTLNVWINDASGQSAVEQIPMMQDSENMDRYYTDVTLSAGDTVTYYVHAIDVTGREFSGGTGSFVRVPEPISLQKTLVVQEGAIDSTNATAPYSIYVGANGLNQILLGNHQTAYFIWNSSDHDGIDESVVNYPNFDLIVKYGWGNMSLPTTGEDFAGYGEFFDRGGRMLFAEMDYFYSTGLPETGAFSLGDFAFDYFGLGTYINDPSDGTNGTGDLSMTGVAVDPVSGAWSSTAYGPLDYEAIGFSNWGDFVYANGVDNAASIFTGTTSFNSMAVRYNGMGKYAPFKTVYYGFPIEAGADFSALLSDSYDWLMGTGGPSSAPSVISPADDDTISINSGNIYTDTLSFVFMTGSVTDPDDDVIGYRVEFSDGLDLELPATSGNNVKIAYSDLADVLDVNASITLTWSIFSTDGLDEVESSPRTLTLETGSLGVNDEIMPNKFALYQNVPNPFNPVTNIRFEIGQQSNVKIKVYNIIGREIVVLTNQSYTSGLYSLVWDGRDNHGLHVSSGMYFYEITAIDAANSSLVFRKMHKMILMK